MCALAASPLVAPGDLGAGDGTALAWACEARLVDVVTAWLADPRCDAAVVSHRDTQGGSAFSDACNQLVHSSDKGGRGAALACALALAHSPHLQPETLVDSDGSTALLWACRAQLHDTVAGWLALPSCTRAVFAARCLSEPGPYARYRGASPFSAACAAVCDFERYDPVRPSPVERSAAAAAARAIAASPHVQPDDPGERGGPALLWASSAGLSDVVAALLASARCTHAVVTALDESRESAFSVACKGAGATSSLTAACARVLAASPLLGPGDTTGHAHHTSLHSACGVGLVAVVTAWLSDPCCTAAVVAQRGGAPYAGAPTHSAFSALLGRLDAATELSADELRDTVACARALGGSPHLPANERAQLLAAAATVRAAVAGAEGLY